MVSSAPVYTAMGNAVRYLYLALKKQQRPKNTGCAARALYGVTPKPNQTTRYCIPLCHALRLRYTLSDHTLLNPQLHRQATVIGVALRCSELKQPPRLEHIDIVHLSSKNDQHCNHMVARLPRSATFLSFRSLGE